MLRLLHEKSLPEAFNCTPEERKQLLDLVSNLETIHREKGPATTWLIQRIWIDETFSDNLKAFAIFMLGYSHANQERRGGKGDLWKNLL